MVNSSDFAKRLEKIFLYYDLNASSFAEKIDVGRASISHLLSGRNKPSLDFVMKVVKTFPEVELYWLLNGKGNFPKRSHAENEVGAKIQNENSTSSTQSKSKEISENQSPTPISDASNQTKVINPNEKSIQRIVIFYTDGTFEAFNHS